jgi:hypothetical protein
VNYSLSMSAPRGNKNANKTNDDLAELIPLYIQHMADGFSKKSFIQCDYRTIEKYLESNIDLHSLKKELEKAERIGRKGWEEIGQQISNGKLRGNPATWIFTMKNKYPEDYKDTQKIEHTGGITITGIEYIIPNEDKNPADV